jgi:uncharacterized membrane protein YtjA (UPF0391 family)
VNLLPGRRRASSDSRIAALSSITSATPRLDHPAGLRNEELLPMMSWAVMFFLVAIIAAVFGFGGIAASAAGAAKIVYVVALVLAIVSFLTRGRV